MLQGKRVAAARQLDTYRDWIAVPKSAAKYADAGVVDGKTKWLREQVIMLPLKFLPLRVAKFDLVLRDGPLRAVHGKQTMLARMVFFNCNACHERFPAIHTSRHVILICCC